MLRDCSPGALEFIGYVLMCSLAMVVAALKICHLLLRRAVLSLKLVYQSKFCFKCGHVDGT